MKLPPAKDRVSSCPIDTMIITNLINNFNKNLFLQRRSRSFLNSYLQSKYNESIALISLDSLKCPHCHHSGFSFHGYYKRHIYIFGRKYCITITRVICRHCHKTHAILIEDIIPYSQLRFEDILCMIQNKCTDDFDISLLSYILNKYILSTLPTYQQTCLINCRNHSCMFIST